MGKIGTLSEVQGEATVEWKIKDFFQLPDEIDIRYESSRFYFSGASWEIRIYPNGQMHNSSDSWISLYLARKSAGSPVAMDFTFSFKTISGYRDSEINFRHVFDDKNSGGGKSKVISRSQLMEKKCNLTTSEDLIIICTLRSSESRFVAGSLFSRLQELSDNFKQLYINAKKPDITLKASGQDIEAHRLVLETRSPVFSAMFSHDTKENLSGEVSIPDLDKNSIESILIYMYSGEVNDLSTENVLSVYAAADKYDLQNIKDICSEFIIRNLSVDWVCEVIKFAELYDEDEIAQRALEFFKDNANEVLESDGWDSFAKENKLLKTVIKTLLKK